jgi:hypothetical protein
MNSKITREKNRFVAFLGRARLGTSNRYEGARNLVTCHIRALNNDERIASLEKKIRNARQRCFQYAHENTMRNVEVMKAELIARRNRCFAIDIPKLKAAI